MVVVVASSWTVELVFVEVEVEVGMGAALMGGVEVADTVLDEADDDDDGRARQRFLTVVGARGATASPAFTERGSATRAATERW